MSISTARIPFLDALRGVLALAVVAAHVLLLSGHSWQEAPSQVAVWLFFAMSGYVLALSWDGDYQRFLLRRLARLWPVYAVCIAAAAAVGGRQDVLWLVTVDARGALAVDPPCWSLLVEFAVAPALPLAFWVVRTAPSRSWPLLVAVGLGCAGPIGLWAGCFLAGAALTRFVVRWPTAPEGLVWLGRISFSLYLSHWVVLKAFGPWAGLALVLPVAWLVWWGVERPVMGWSRRVCA